MTPPNPSPAGAKTELEKAIEYFDQFPKQDDCFNAILSAAKRTSEVESILLAIRVAGQFGDGPIVLQMMQRLEAREKDIESYNTLQSKLTTAEHQCDGLKLSVELLTQEIIELRAKLETAERDISALQMVLHSSHDMMLNWFSSEYASHPATKEISKFIVGDENKFTQVIKDRATALSRVKKLSQQLSSQSADVKLMVEALASVKPDPNCPWCSKADDEPCSHCMEMARLQGQFTQALSTPTAQPFLKS